MTDLDFKGKVLLHVLDDHDEEGQLDAQRLLGICRAGDVCRADIGAHDFNDQRLDIGVGDALDVAIAYLEMQIVEEESGEGGMRRVDG